MKLRHNLSLGEYRIGDRVLITAYGWSVKMNSVGRTGRVEAIRRGCLHLRMTDDDGYGNTHVSARPSCVSKILEEQS